MTAAFLLMSSAALAGADVAPPPAAPAPAPIVIGSGGCTDCGTPAPCGCGSSKVGLLDKLKGRFSGFGRKSHDCGCAPVPSCAPVPPPLPCNTCNTCTTSISNRPNLFDKLKARGGHHKGSCCGPVCDPCGASHLSGCATPGTPYVPPGTGTTPPPKEMPKPKDTTPPKGGASAPLPPVNGASGLTGSGSPY